MTDLRDAVGYLLWQIDQGYISAEDRAVGSNWFDLPDHRLHPNDIEARTAFRETADLLIEVMRTEHPPEPVERVTLTEEQFLNLAHQGSISADSVVIGFTGTPAARTRAGIERALEALEANGLIRFVDPEEYPAFYSLDPPYTNPFG